MQYEALLKFLYVFALLELVLDRPHVWADVARWDCIVYAVNLELR